ncbi:hypothetical protein E3983_02005 [Legionella israelensis]|uniref:Uncharacterized protein n=1 Tax=Legionella israelensis TaxID=454 RepID=A0AAX1EDZ8_9GAMM|nr:hypothetical protein [Legionella israelensis]QBR83237.1 hypothetical protein E3983_02005 [Legionella israelensis]
MKGNLPDESEKKTDLGSNPSSFFKSRLDDVKLGSTKAYVENKVIGGLRSAEEYFKIIEKQGKPQMEGASKANEEGAGQIRKGIEEIGNILEHVFTSKHTHTS